MSEFKAKKAECRCLLSADKLSDNFASTAQNPKQFIAESWIAQLLLDGSAKRNTWLQVHDFISFCINFLLIVIVPCHFLYICIDELDKDAEETDHQYQHHYGEEGEEGLEEVVGKSIKVLVLEGESYFVG